MIQGAPENNGRVEALKEQLEISRIKWSFIVRANYVNSFLDLAFGISMTVPRLDPGHQVWLADLRG